MNIILIGPMGAGKSSVGLRLSKELGLEFLDSDKEIEFSTGVDIPYIFETEGEEGFRKRERKIIDLLTQRQNIVLATGGGAVLDQENRKVLSNRGNVVYLYASVEKLIDRTRKSCNRPLLQTENPEETLRKIISEREKIYIELADIVIDTEEGGVERITQKVIDKLGLS